MLISSSPTPRPGLSPPYRGPLQFLPGAPTLHELITMTLLLVGGLLLVIVSWRLVRSYVRGWWDGPFAPGHWRAGGAAVSLLAGVGLLSMLWRDLGHIAARMGLTAVVLAVLLVTELDISDGSRRRR